MAMNLVDSKEIMMAYEAVLNDELNWFLLHYPGNTADELALYAYGADGLEELKTKLDPSNIEQVLIGFLRADDIGVPDSEFYGAQGLDQHYYGRRREASVRDEVKYVLISYVPKGVLGVRRARAQVHARRLGMIFKKHDAMLTVEDYWQLTNSTIARSLAEPDSPSSPSFPTGGRGAIPPFTQAPGVAGTGPGTLSTHTPPSSTAGTVIYTTDSNIISPGTDLLPQQPSPPATRMGRSFSQPAPYNQMQAGPLLTETADTMDLRPLRSLDPHPHELQRYNTTTHLGGQQQSNQRPGGHTFGQFLRRKKQGRYNKGGGDMDESQESEDSMPPPTPPKDKGIYATMLGMIDKRRVEEKERDGYTYRQPRRAYTEDDLELHKGKLEHNEFANLPKISETSFQHVRDVSEYALVSHEDISGGGEEGDVVVIHPDRPGMTREVPTAGQMLRMESLKKGKWAEPRGLSAIRDPVERARMRMEMQRRKEEEEREAQRAEEERQESIKREKQEILKREEEEAERRKAIIQAEASRVAAERRRREEEERLDEERRAREREEKKRMEKQKRLEEHLRLEEWRKAQQRLKEENIKAEEEAKRREDEERKQKILQAQQEVQAKARDGTMTGWVTIQTDESVAWRRRYYKFSPHSLYFYRSPKDTAQAVERLDIRGAVTALKEPKEGYEDLAAIPHSFAVEFGGRPPWSMFADSEDEKIRLLGLLQYGAGL